MATTKKALDAARVSYRQDIVPVELVHANPWNPNVQDDRTYRATVESIATFGFVDPVTVRAHPDLEGHWQAIDGEHRWKAAQELSITHVPIIILDVDTATAKRLTVVLNETRGEPDSVLLGGLLAALQDEIGDEFRKGMRYDDAELKHLLALADADWNKYEAPGEDGNGAAGGGEDAWATLTLRVPQDFMDVWGEACQKARDAGTGLHDDEKVAGGQVLELLCAEYLASAPVE